MLFSLTWLLIYLCTSRIVVPLPRQYLGTSASGTRRSPPKLYTKRLPLALLSHMVLLSLAQAVTHVAAPAAKPPAAPIVRLTNRKDGGNRQRKSPLSDTASQETAIILANQMGNNQQDT